MNIGEAARATGVSTKMIRYYEQIALIRPADRTDGNYRSFSDRDINDLKFVKRARSLGFSLVAIADLLSLWRDPNRTRAEVTIIVEGHLSGLEARLTEMQAMIDALKGLARAETVGARPGFPEFP